VLLDKDDGNSDEAIENATWTCVKAVSLLLLGTAMAAAFADPLVDIVQNFSKATNIPSLQCLWQQIPARLSQQLYLQAGRSSVLYH
jgi:hypothetical protein